MGKLYDRLQEQLSTEYKQDAEDCLKIYEKLLEVDKGHLWERTWNILVRTIFKGFPSNERRFKPTNVGYVFLNGLNSNLK